MQMLRMTTGHFSKWRMGLFKKEEGCYAVKSFFFRHKGFKNKKSQAVTLGQKDVLFRHPGMYPQQVALQQSLLPFSLQCKCKPYLGLLKKVSTFFSTSHSRLKRKVKRQTKCPHFAKLKELQSHAQDDTICCTFNFVQPRPSPPTTRLLDKFADC